MPRKPLLKKIRTHVVVKGAAIPVTLYPPKPPRKSWYAYWAGLRAARSTRQVDFDKAIEIVSTMLRNNGKVCTAGDLKLTDGEFVEIQRRHFSKKQERAMRRRAEKSLYSCLEAISAFRDISGVNPVISATPDDCERFQSTALALPKDWLRRHDSESKAPHYSPNTVIKWSRELQAAFERANRNAGRKCVRGVVDERRLLTENPWHRFTWIAGIERPIRQLDDAELVGVLHFLETHWPGVRIASSLAKTLLWSWGRKEEVVGLTWDSLRLIDGEVHFEIVGKWGIEKWFRIPHRLHEELLDDRTDSPFVFEGYVRQLRAHHDARGCPTNADLVKEEFRPANLAKWFERRLSSWSRDLDNGRVTPHVFRKTALQYARRGEDVNAAVAHDARLGASVMMRHYVKETDPERRAASNRTFYRIAASLAPETAYRYGHSMNAKSREELETELQHAVHRKDYARVARLSSALASQRA
jgi:integrase